MSRRALYVIGLVVLVLGGLVVLVLVGPCGGATRDATIATRDADRNRKAAALDQFCSGTKLMLETDLHWLEGPEPGNAGRKVVVGLVSGDAARHGHTSVETCLGARVPPEPDNWMQCWMEYDYACVARQVRAYRDALVKAGW